jgi:hypothetical protein
MPSPTRLQKDDWVAVAYYDMQPHILVDFTQDKKAVYGALNQLRIPGFAETNLFDALYDTLDRLDRVEGKKYIILVTTGHRYLQQAHARQDHEEDERHERRDHFPHQRGIHPCASIAKSTEAAATRTAWASP